MRSLRRFSRALAIAAVCAATPVAVHAQSCDYKIVSATWHPHPSPDSIYVDFTADISVNFAVSSDSTHPTTIPTQVAIRFNGAPMIAPQDLILLWWQRMADCTPSCPAGVVCEVKEWMFKTIIFRDQSLCARNSSGVCGCPPLGTPVVEHKPVPKPSGAGIIETEMIPLDLTSCNPINPGNRKKSFYYNPASGGGGGFVPGLGRAGGTALIASLLLLGLLAVRRRESGGLA